MRFATVLSFISASAALVSGIESQTRKVKIMALGDSITGSPGCWRALLWRKLQETSITNIDFVGTLPGQGCGFTYDGENEGHGGYLATNIASQGQLVAWLTQTTPDIVMMHLGTNDVWNNKSPQEILGAFQTLVEEMRQSNKNMRILVAKIIPMNPSNCQSCGQRVVALNEAIAKWATGISTESSPITVVDCWTGFDTNAMTGDGVHPNAAGNEAVAKCWLQSLVAAIKSVE